MRANEILAATFGWDVREMRECRYQNFTSPAIYSIGDQYFAVYDKPPKHQVGKAWSEYRDQFFAAPTGRKIWVCKAGLQLSGLASSKSSSID